MSEVMGRKITVSGHTLEKRLKGAIEALDDGRITHSAGATTDRGTVHRSFRNGIWVLEGAVLPEDAAPACFDQGYSAYFKRIDELEEMTFSAVNSYRQEIDGRVNLVWRSTPEIRDGVVYVRLSFEPILVEVHPGVWLDERLTRV